MSPAPSLARNVWHESLVHIGQMFESQAQDVHVPRTELDRKAVPNLESAGIRLCRTSPSRKESGRGFSGAST